METAKGLGQNVVVQWDVPIKVQWDGMFPMAC